MDWSTVIAVIVVTLFISAIAATAGYYLQRRLKRLEELEQEVVTLSSPPPPPPLPPSLAGPLEERTEPVRGLPGIAASLIIATGPQAGQSFRPGINTLIGRNPALCDVVLAHSTVSGQHAKIQQEEEQFYIYDLSSTNGTWVNNQRIQRAELHDGDRIKLGSAEELVFKVEGRNASEG